MRYLIAGCLALVISGHVAAHEKFKFVGSVAAIKPEEIAIKAIDGATYEMDFLDTTAVTDKNHKKVDRSLLKVGAKVVVMALGHDMFDLEAVEVQLVER
ncbi:MAG TPA: hypothetical protein VEA16_18555 [Vicinamibacterales bacterium]|nr:hypothetical protein [Vicinamibacterales bacterium]